MDKKEVHKIGYVLAGYYAAQCENDGGKFCDFGADAIHHCYEYCDIVDNIDIPYTNTERGEVVDTECYRNLIYNAIFDTYTTIRRENFGDYT